MTTPNTAPDPSGSLSRILVRGVNWLGDAVMTTPALIRLRERFPAARITLVTPAKLADLWQHHPAIDEVIEVEAKPRLFRTVRCVRAAAGQLGILFPNSHRAALEFWLARVPRRLGTSVRGRDWLLTDVAAARPGFVAMRKPAVKEVRRRRLLGISEPPPPPSAHQLYHYLHLVSALGGDPAAVRPQLVVRDSEVAAVRAKFTLDPAVTWIGLNPGAEYGPAKRWPARRFADVARQLGETGRRRFVLLGGPGDRELTRSIAFELRRKEGVEAGSEPLNLAGSTSLRELGAVLRACAVLLTNDTGPMHLAAALGVPVVALFGSTSPELTGPGLGDDPRVRILRRPVACSPCFLRECPVDFDCLEGLEAGTVAEAVRAYLPSPGD